MFRYLVFAFFAHVFASITTAIVGMNMANILKNSAASLDIGMYVPMQKTIATQSSRVPMSSLKRVTLYSSFSCSEAVL